MKYFTLLAIFIYLLHITLGPYFMSYLLNFEKPKWISKNLNEVLRRAIWATYVSILMIAYFNEYPNEENFLISLLLSIASSIGYIFKFWNSQEFYRGVISHFIYLIIPVIYLGFYYKINILNYQPTTLSLVSFIYFITFSFYDQIIYIGGLNI